MKIQEHDQFHGAALTQIVQHPSFKALNKLDSKFGHYRINADICILVKYRTNRESPWQFILNGAEIETLKSDCEADDTNFLCLVCGDSTICAINRDQIKQLIDLSATGQQWIKAEVPDGGSIWLKGSSGSLKRCIPHKNFPDILFSD
jgi:hypothetical protein